MAMGTKRAGRFRVDHRVHERIKAKQAKEREANIDELVETQNDIPVGDGIDHARWKPWQRKLVRLLTDFSTLNMSNEDLAVACGVSIRSITRMKNDPEFLAYQNAVSAKEYSYADPIWMAAVIDGMRKGDDKKLDMFAKARGFYKAASINVNVKDERGTGANESLEDQIARLRKEAGLDDSDEKVVN